MAWRLMWHPRSNISQSGERAPISFLSDDVAGASEARAMVRQLRAEGCTGISVTASGAAKIMSGTALQRWLDQVPA